MTLPHHPCHAPSIICYPVYLGDFGSGIYFAEARREDWWAKCRAQPTTQASDRRESPPLHRYLRERLLADH